MRALDPRDHRVVVAAARFEDARMQLCPLSLAPSVGSADRQRGDAPEDACIPKMREVGIGPGCVIRRFRRLDDEQRSAPVRLPRCPDERSERRKTSHEEPAACVPITQDEARLGLLTQPGAVFGVTDRTILDCLPRDVGNARRAPPTTSRARTARRPRSPGRRSRRTRAEEQARKPSPARCVRGARGGVSWCLSTRRRASGAPDQVEVEPFEELRAVVAADGGQNTVNLGSANASWRSASRSSRLPATQSRTPSETAWAFFITLTR